MDLEIELFRADTPASKGITAAQLGDVVGGFDGERNPGPVVMGHPSNDQSAPAFGAVTALRQEGSKLFGTIKGLAQEAVDGIKARRILNRSAAFWHPQHPSNPTPGKLSFRHLGLLGGSPPAIPNMAPLAFAADDDTLQVNAEPAEPVIFSAAAPAAEPDLDQLADKVAERLKPQENPGKENTVATEQELQEKEAALAAREAELAEKETAFAADQEKRAKEAKDALEADNAKFAADLVQAGKFPAGHKDDLVAILNALPQDTLQFSGDTTATPGTQLRTILGAAQPGITFAAVTPAGDPPQFGADDDAEAKALAAANAKLADAHKGGTTA